MGLFSWGRSTGAFPSLQADMHSHLLPGVDDGSKDVKESLELIGSLRQLGYRKLITTPHIYGELYPNTLESMENARGLLPEFDFPFRFAAEYFLDDYVEQIVKAGKPLLTIHENWVLVEISFVQPPPDLDRRIFELQVGGYKPIMAHPERYPFWHGNKEIFHGLKERGVLLQVNLLSLIGYYGRPVMETAQYLLREELVDLTGTDCHHQRHIEALRKGGRLLDKTLTPLLKKDKLLNPFL
jgi:protein-tyrosine phosphatase